MKNKSFLDLLVKSDKVQFFSLLNSASEEQVNFLSELFLNILKKQQSLKRKEKNILGRISCSKLGYKTRKKLMHKNKKILFVLVKEASRPLKRLLQAI